MVQADGDTRLTCIPELHSGKQGMPWKESDATDPRLYFFASNRPYADAYGNVPCEADDLYVTHRRDDGTFDEPRVMRRSSAGS